MQKEYETLLSKYGALKCMDILNSIDKNLASRYFLPSGCGDMVQEMINVLEEVDKKFNLKISEN